MTNTKTMASALNLQPMSSAGKNDAPYNTIDIVGFCDLIG